MRYKLSPDAKFATSPINISDTDYDFSLDLSYISIVEKNPFYGIENEDAMKHMNELATLSNVFSDDTKMCTYFITKFFPFALKGAAKAWYDNLSPGSIKIPKDLVSAFFQKKIPLKLNMLLCRIFLSLCRKREKYCLYHGQDSAL